MPNTAWPKYVLPNVLSISRIVAGPAYLMWGAFPVSTSQMTMLLLIGATDLVDGRLARRWRTTTVFGRFADALGDRILIASVLAKMAINDAITMTAAVVIGVQYALLSALIIIYKQRLGAAPPADFWGKLGAGFAVIASIMGATGTSETAAEVMVWLFAAANVIYFAVVGKRMRIAEIDYAKIRRYTIESNECSPNN